MVSLSKSERIAPATRCEAKSTKTAEDNGLDFLPKHSNFVDVHQLIAAGRGVFGAIDSCKADMEWTEDLLTKVASETHKQIHGPRPMDTKNENTAYGKGDSPSDILLLVVKKEGSGKPKDFEYYEQALREYIFDPRFSKNY